MAFTTFWFNNAAPIYDKILAKQKNKTNLHYLEIGCFEGLSTCHFLRQYLTAPGSDITVIDSFQGGREHGHLDLKTLLDVFKENTSFAKDRVKIFQGFSGEMLVKPEVRKQQYDFIHIDGGHESREVLEDAVLSFPLLKEGGIMIFDDYLWETHLPEFLIPKHSIDSFLSSHQLYLDIIQREYQVAIRKVSRKE